MHTYKDFSSIINTQKVFVGAIYYAYSQPCDIFVPNLKLEMGFYLSSKCRVIGRNTAPCLIELLCSTTSLLSGLFVYM